MTDPFFAKTIAALAGPTSGYARTLGPVAVEHDLAMGEARYPFPADVQACLAAATGLDRIWYGDPAGEMSLRLTYLHHLLGGSTHGAVDPQQVLITAGGKEAALLGVRYLVDAFAVRCVLIPRPGWEPYTVWADALGCRAIAYDPAAVAADPAALRSPLATNTALAGPPPLLIINYPHNPTGQAVSQAHMDRIVVTAAEFGVPVLSDEVYRPFAAEDVSAARAPAFDPARHLIADSTSKWLFAAGLRVGFLHAAANVIAILTAFRASYASCTSPLTQHVAETLMTSSKVDAWLDATRQTLDADRLATVKALGDHGVAVASHGGLYLWGHRPDPDALPVQATVAAARISDGAGFGTPGMFRACIARAGIDPGRAAAAIRTALAGT